jgi:hypothetical protein
MPTCIRTKVDCSGKSLRVLREIWGFWNSLSYKIVLKTRKFREAPRHIVGQLNESLLGENVFQNPQIFRKTLRLFPEHSTLDTYKCFYKTTKVPWGGPTTFFWAVLGIWYGNTMALEDCRVFFILIDKQLPSLQKWPAHSLVLTEFPLPCCAVGLFWLFFFCKYISQFWFAALRPNSRCIV